MKSLFTHACGRSIMSIAVKTGSWPLRLVVRVIFLIDCRAQLSTILSCESCWTASLRNASKLRLFPHDVRSSVSFVKSALGTDGAAGPAAGPVVGGIAGPAVGGIMGPADGPIIEGSLCGSGFACDGIA